jgi:hypothetical protein
VLFYSGLSALLDLTTAHEALQSAFEQRHIEHEVVTDLIAETAALPPAQG